MPHKVADKMRVNRERMPTNIVENFGNASGATIPTNITFNLAKELTAGTRRLEDQLRSMLEIAAHTFTDDRVLVAPKISDWQRLSSARHTAYVRQSFERPDEHVYHLVNPATRETVAFKTHRIVSAAEALMLLGGVHVHYKNAGARRSTRTTSSTS